MARTAILIVTAAGVLLCGSCLWSTRPTEGRTIFVDTASVAERPDGSTRTKAFRTIQEACDVADAGDVIIVARGVYFEHVRLRRAGTPEKPIVIRADRVAPGRVTITGANRVIREGKSRWELLDPELGLYAVSHPTLLHRPSRVLYSRVDLQPYPSVGELRRFSFLNPEGYPGAAHGFAWDGRQKKLFVRLHASGRYGEVDPNQHAMAVSPPTGSGFAGLGIEEPSHFNFGIYGPHDQPIASHVVLDGLTFETPGVAGVFIASGGDVTLRNCWCFGCRTLVSGRRFFNDRPDYSVTTNNVLVENCEFTQYAAFDDMVEVIEEGRAWARAHGSHHGSLGRIYWWHRKGAANGAIGGTANTYEVGLASAVGRGWVFRNNFVHDAFEGLSTWALSTSQDTLVEGNRFERLIDNAVESENHAKNLTIRDNTVIDVFEPFSWQPLSGPPWPGPISIHHNIIVDSFRVGEMWLKAGDGFDASWFPGVFKIGALTKTSKTELGSRDAQADAITVPSSGFRVWHNTVFAPGHRLIAHVGNSMRYENFKFRNNIIVVDDFNGGDERFRDVGVDFGGNVVFAFSRRDQAGAELAAGPGGRVVDTLSAVGLRNPEHRDVSLSPDSSAIGAVLPLTDYERSTTDAGALSHSEIRRTSSVVGPRVDY